MKEKCQCKTEFDVVVGKPVSIDHCGKPVAFSENIKLECCQCSKVINVLTGEFVPTSHGRCRPRIFIIRPTEMNTGITVSAAKTGGPSEKNIESPFSNETLVKLNLRELKIVAKRQGIKGFRKMGKEELIKNITSVK